MKSADGKLENVLAGFCTLGFVGKDAALEKFEDGIFREEVIFVKSAGVGQEVELSLFLGEMLHKFKHRFVGSEYVVPNICEKAFATLKTNQFYTLGKKFVITDSARFEIIFKGRKQSQDVFSARFAVLSQCLCGRGEIEAKQHVADVKEVEVQR